MSHLAPIIQVNDASYPKPQLLYDCPYIQSHLCQQVKVYFPTPESSNFSGEDKDEETAYMLFAIGFCLFVTWIINICMFIKSDNKQARKYAQYSLTAILIHLYLLFVFIISLCYLFLPMITYSF